MKKNKNKAENSNARDKERASIADQVQAYIDNGGKIEVLSSAFDKQKDPKCRLGEEMGLFV